MQSVRYLVVGAGVSGLSFADHIDSDDYLVLEATDAIGGYCKTVVQDGFTWDYSGHFFHFRHPDIEAELVSRMGAQRILKIVKDSRIRFGDGYVDFPFQKNIHQLPHADFLECLADLVLKSDARADSFKEMLYARFGRGIAEKFLVPYNEKLYATDLGNLDPDAMGRFFPYANLEEIVKNFRAGKDQSYNATFTYPEGGAIEYVRAIAKGVDERKVALGEALVGIDLRTRTATTRARTIRFEHLVSCIPLHRLLELSRVPFDASLYTSNKVEVFNLGFDRKGPEGVHWIYYPQRDISFYRVGFYDNIFGTDRMSIYVEIGRRTDEHVDDATRDVTRARVLEDLARVGVIDGHALVSSHHVVLDPAYVHITREGQRDVAEKKALLEASGVSSIGRYGSWTYCSIEDNIVEARMLAKRFNARDAI